MTKLLRITRSPKPDKFLRATFLMETGREKNVDFGSTMENYTQHHDKERRRLYRLRHQKDLKTNDPTRPGFLALGILWGDSTSLDKNIQDYKRKFGL